MAKLTAAPMGAAAEAARVAVAVAVETVVDVVDAIAMMADQISPRKPPKIAGTIQS